MSDDFLSRWSRRKHQARKGEALAEPAPPPSPASPGAGTLPAGMPPAANESKPASEAPPLPPIESLTADSDFTAFMNPEVDRGVRSRALKTLFSDPHFNVMDGLDVYIDDYSKPDPMPEGWLEKMTQVARLGAFEPAAEPPPDAVAEGEKVADPVEPVAAPKDPPPCEGKNEET